MTMTNSAQNEAIAKACGWTINTEPPYQGMAWEPGTPPHGKTVHTSYFHSLPNYTGSLDACHEMEKALTEEQLDKYVYHMEALRYLGVFATAAQRCECFLKAMDLWHPAQASTQGGKTE